MGSLADRGGAGREHPEGAALLKPAMGMETRSCQTRLVRSERLVPDPPTHPDLARFLRLSAVP
jgi:hypothetical protein